MIKGVVTKRLTRHHDERGYFQENIRATDPFFEEGFGQWAGSKMYQDVVKAWHIHLYQSDFWYCEYGVIKAVLCDLRGFARNVISKATDWQHLKHLPLNNTVAEYILGLPDDPYILKIPPGVAHGCKVLQGPAKLSYITSEVYNPDDEGRIPHDALGYDWLKEAEIT